MTHEYLFDVKLFASIRVRAASEKEARAILDECLDCAELSVMSGGKLEPTFEASMDGEPDLVDDDE